MQISAPTASVNPPDKAVDAARKVAPSVDQATAAGIRVAAGNQTLHTPMAKVAKNSPVAGYTWVAPTAVSPANTIANDAA